MKVKINAKNILSIKTEFNEWLKRNDGKILEAEKEKFGYTVICPETKILIYVPAWAIEEINSK